MGIWHSSMSFFFKSKNIATSTCFYTFYTFYYDHMCCQCWRVTYLFKKNRYSEIPCTIITFMPNFNLGCSNIDDTCIFYCCFWDVISTMQYTISWWTTNSQIKHSKFQNTLWVTCTLQPFCFKISKMFMLTTSLKLSICWSSIILNKVHFFNYL